MANPSDRGAPFAFSVEVNDGEKWRTVENPPDLPPPTREGLLAYVESACDRLAEAAKKAGLTGRGVRADTWREQSAFIKHGKPDEYLLPKLAPLWTACKLLNLPGLPPFPGEPQNAPEAFNALDQLAECLHMPEHLGAPPATPNEPDWKAVVEAVADDNAVTIINVAGDADKTADERIRLIYAIDSRVLGKSSGKWGDMLGVSSAAVRQTSWWKVDRKSLRR